MAPKGPVHEIRLGTIRAAIWVNQSEPSDVWFNVTLSRLYKDSTAWKDSSSFRRDDLPVAAKALEMAYAWIWDHQAASNPHGGMDQHSKSVASE